MAGAVAVVEPPAEQPEDDGRAGQLDRQSHGVAEAVVQLTLPVRVHAFHPLVNFFSIYSAGSQGRNYAEGRR